MEHKTKKDTSFTLGCFSGGPALSGAIILARALCGSSPMEEWSVLSWILMTLPVTIPIVLGLGFLALWAIAAVFSLGRRP